VDGNGRQPRAEGDGGIGVLERVREEYGIFSTEAANIRADFQALAAKQVDLLKAEAAEQARLLTRIAVVSTSAGMLGFLAVAFLAVTTYALLDSVMDAALAAFITALILGALAGIAFMFTRRLMNRLSFMPRRTINSLREDAEWLQTLTSSNKKYETSARRSPPASTT
jgi:hypothetical protein